jgi:hypothetical protein
MEQPQNEESTDEPPSCCQYILHKDLNYRHLLLVFTILITFGSLSIHNSYIALFHQNFIKILGLKLSILFNITIVACCLLYGLIMLGLICFNGSVKIKKCFYYIFAFIEICLFLSSIASLFIYPTGIILNEFTQIYIICNIIFVPIFILCYHIG